MIHKGQHHTKDHITQNVNTQSKINFSGNFLFSYHIYIASISLPNHWQNGRMCLFSCPTQPLENHSVSHLDDCWIIRHSISWHQCLSRFLGQGRHCQAAEVVPGVLHPGSVQSISILIISLPSFCYSHCACVCVCVCVCVCSAFFIFL